jgi:two-component system, chemotaxis family, sensor kinase Cph1
MSGAEIIYPGVGQSIQYEDEPEGRSGLIQPYGVLLVLSIPDLTIVQASRNASDHFQVQLQTLLNCPLSQLCDQSSIDLLHQIPIDQERVGPFRLTLTTPGHRSWDGCLYRSENLILLELEPARNTSETPFANCNQSPT